MHSLLYWQIGTKNLTRREFIVEASFFTSWTIRSDKCARAHVQKNKTIYQSIYLSLWKPFWKRVYIYIYIYTRPFSKRFSYREIYRYIDTSVFLHVRPCAFFTRYCPTWQKTRFNDTFFLRRVLCSNLKRACRWVFFRKVHAPCNKICNGELHGWL